MSTGIGQQQFEGGYEHYAFEASELNHLEASIRLGISTELEQSNVERMARDTFSFYICVRWVPDPTFWEMARKELTMDMVGSFFERTEDQNDEQLEQAIAELYQTYKFVPLLCSQNMEVFSGEGGVDGTYFGRFKQDVDEIITWLESASSDPVMERLREADEVFCGTTNMNDPGCETTKSWWERVSGWAGIGEESDTAEDKWGVMWNIFQSFEVGHPGMPASWDAALPAWKERFPFLSFVHKPTGMPPEFSPTSSQRFMVCHGKRVGSTLHRRPSGSHIMTAQNTQGCHGFWEVTETREMLQRMMMLWKPPTCQLATMHYTMKRRILQMFAFMNERLFDALPAMIMDELVLSQSQYVSFPAPVNPRSLTINGVMFVDGMRVQALTEIIRFPLGCVGTWDFRRFLPQFTVCDSLVQAGDVGNVVINQRHLTVRWDMYQEQLVAVGASHIQIMPDMWPNALKLHGYAHDLVAGVTQVEDRAFAIFDAVFRTRYAGLSTLMTDSTTKWVVCKIKSDANYTLVDTHLSTEDATFMDHSREVYASWTGYTDVPGVNCESQEGDPRFDAIPGSQLCEIAELHADNFERYTNDEGELEQFICPRRMMLPPAEQLSVLQEKGQCLLHMTGSQAQHAEWHYNGYDPMMRQHDRMENWPSAEYELIKLIRVPAGENGAVAFARMCSVQELNEAPRFCHEAELLNGWDSLEDMASDLSEAIIGSLGVGAAAVGQSIARYSTTLAEGSHSRLETEMAMQLGETTWDTLTGPSRLVRSAGEEVVSPVSDGLPGAFHRDARIEAEMFGEDCACGLLHSLSFQRRLGLDFETNREAFQRFVVPVPCDDFDPALEFAVKKRWASVTLRTVQAVLDHDGLGFLERSSSLQLALRGEGRMFEEPASQMMSLTYGAAIKSAGDAWFATSDTQLVSTVTRNSMAASNIADQVGTLSGIQITLYCGAKSSFGAAGGPGPISVEDSSTFRTCLEEGYLTNARIRAEEPMKMYFPAEVVVVATFEMLGAAECAPSEAGQSSNDILCEGARASNALDDHLEQSDMEMTGLEYQGVRSGAGLPRGIPREVILRPEDVLEAVSLLDRERRLQDGTEPEAFSRASCPR